MNLRITEQDIEAVTACLRDKQISGRSKIVNDFEIAFAEYVGAKYAVSCNSGSSALFLALQACHISSGRVACPDFGYIAVPNAIVQSGAIPAFYDVERTTGNIDPNIIYDQDIRALITIDTYGHSCDYDLIRKNNPHLLIIEDAAEALSGEYKHERLGGLWQVDVTCFSLFANKTITAGEGGMITTNNLQIATRLRMLRDQFSTAKKYYHTELGYSLCLSAMQAALALSQLSRIDDILKQKREEYWYLNEKFKSELIRQALEIKDYTQSSFWVYPMILADSQISVDRFLELHEDARPFFTPFHLQPMYLSEQKFPHAEFLHKNGVYLPT